ncbi:MAG TPA: autotransporter assembly complex family protein [Azospirillum sp.]|nr:autotransporter assembly complex family protein [Azospirillum sp.]
MIRTLLSAVCLLLALALLLAPLAARAQDEPAPEEPKVPYEVELSGVEDSALRELLRGSSSLFELKDAPPPSIIGLERRADSDRDRLQTALRSAGYYDAQLDVRIDPDARPVKVTIAVMPGPAYTFKTIEVQTATGGPMPGGPVGLDDLGIRPGRTARAPEVVDAQSKLVAALAGRGYAFAKVADRHVVVDHSDRTMDVTFVVDPGPLTHFGAVEIQGLEEVDESLVRGRLPWTPGALYEPGLVEKARTDIAKLGVFDTVRVQLAGQPGPDGVTPVTVTVAERKRRFIGAGVTYSTTEGFGANAFWGHRNLFGGAEQLRLSFEIGRLAGETSETSELGLPDLRFGVNFRKPDFLAPRQSLLLDFSVVADNPPAYERVAGILTTALEREISDELRVSAGITSEQGEVRASGRTYQVSLIGVPLTAAYDGTGNLLNPTRGLRLGAAVTPWFPVVGNETNSPFVVTTVTGSTYYDFRGDGRYVGAVRAGVGSIVGTTLSDIPPDRRLYAGGGGSVRGFGFQRAGPRDQFGDPTGGRALLELGAEMRIKVTETIGVVPFVDAGTVYDRSFPDFSEPLRVGAGLGLRYFTDFGPLRVDVGIPLNPDRGDSRWQLYLSLGQAF